MRPYFEQMAGFGKALKENQRKRTEENVDRVKEVEAGLAEAVEQVKNARNNFV